MGPKRAIQVEILAKSLKMPVVGRDFITEALEQIEAGEKPARYYNIYGEPSLAETYLLAQKLEAECVSKR